MTTLTVCIFPAHNAVIARDQFPDGAVIADENTTVVGLSLIDQTAAAKLTVAETLQLGGDTVWSEFEWFVGRESAVERAV